MNTNICYGLRGISGEKWIEMGEMYAPHPRQRPEKILRQITDYKIL